MTSDCAGDQNSQEPNGSNSVQATSAIGGHGRLNEAPRCVYCGMPLRISSEIAMCDSCLRMKARFA